MTLEEKIKFEKNMKKELTNARNYAKQGNVLLMEFALDSAKDFAEQGKLDISESVIAVKKIGYVKSLPVELAKARNYAEQGNESDMAVSIDLAKRCAEYVKQDVSEEVTVVKKICYVKALPIKLAEAKEHAEKGDFILMRIYLDLAQSLADQRKVDISDQVEEIKKISDVKKMLLEGNIDKEDIQKELEKELVNARVYAEKGDARSMTGVVNLASKYAEKVGQDISNQVAEIKKIGYAKSLPLELADLRRYVEEGNFGDMICSIWLVKAVSEFLGQDLSEQLAVMEKTGYANSVSYYLAKAKVYAEKGNMAYMFGSLCLAQLHAIPVEQDISKKVDVIKKIGYINGIPVELADARNYAKLGEEALTKQIISNMQYCAETVGQDISKDVEEINSLLNMSAITKSLPN